MSSQIPDGEAYGRELAQRIISQARRYGLNSRDMAIMFIGHVDRHARELKVQCLSADELTRWSRSVTAGCRRRIDEEVGNAAETYRFAG